MRPYLVFIGLGASLQTTIKQSTNNLLAQRYGDHASHAVNRLDLALLQLRDSANIQLLDQSSYYQTKAWGQQRAGAYLNAAACLHTRLLPSQLLAKLQSIEYRLARRRNHKRWAPRSIDLDILLYANHHINRPNLSIPHRWMWERDFVLSPLMELSVYLNVAQRQQLQQTITANNSSLLTRPLRLDIQSTDNPIH